MCNNNMTRSSVLQKAVDERTETVMVGHCSPMTMMQVVFSDFYIAFVPYSTPKMFVMVALLP